tara:strand:+ start:7931 stop:8191 length:261 start_codon:yes stop_codon:yes gene_type:complete
MLKIIIISVLVIYLVFKLVGFAFRIMFGAAYEQQKRARQGQQQSQTTRRKAPNSNLNIDTQPDNKQARSNKEYKGGDYVDYEEIKE